MRWTRAFIECLPVDGEERAHLYLLAWEGLDNPHPLVAVLELPAPAYEEEIYAFHGFCFFLIAELVILPLYAGYDKSKGFTYDRLLQAIDNRVPRIKRYQKALPGTTAWQYELDVLEAARMFLTTHG